MAEPPSTFPDSRFPTFTPFTSPTCLGEYDDVYAFLDECAERRYDALIHYAFDCGTIVDHDMLLVESSKLRVLQTEVNFECECDDIFRGVHLYT